MPQNSYAKKIRYNYGGKTTIYIKGKKVMDKGKVLDPEWWREQLKRPQKIQKFEGSDS